LRAETWMYARRGAGDRRFQRRRQDHPPANTRTHHHPHRGRARPAVRWRASSTWATGRNYELTGRENVFLGRHGASHAAPRGQCGFEGIVESQAGSAFSNPDQALLRRACDALAFGGAHLEPPIGRRRRGVGRRGLGLRQKCMARLPDGRRDRTVCWSAGPRDHADLYARSVVAGWPRSQTEGPGGRSGRIPSKGGRRETCPRPWNSIAETNVSVAVQRSPCETPNWSGTDRVRRRGQPFTIHWPSTYARRPRCQ